MTARVMGLDLSAESTGVALADGRTMTVRAPKAAGKRRSLTDDLVRLSNAHEQIGIVLDDQPDMVVIEDYAPGIRSAAAHRLAEIGGVVRLACYERGIPIALVNNQHLKIYAVGRANKVEKGDMRLAALKRTGAEQANDDECDAWWLRAMGLDHLGEPVAVMPADWRARSLDKVTWPERVPAHA